MDQQKYWNSEYKTYLKIPAYDGWLDLYLPLFHAGQKIIDLGCGNGSDSIFLSEKGFPVMACDFSRRALKNLKKRVPGINTRCFDFSKGLPFEDGTVDIIIADLSLHYFDWETTLQIVRDLDRVLTPGGLILGRVNSVDESLNDMAQNEIAHHYYDVNGKTKRYFDRDDLQALFQGWDMVSLSEMDTSKYGRKKEVLAFVVRKS